jgi:hypothetical protein
MDVVLADDLKRLATAGPGPCVSLFLPTHRAGTETVQDPIRLKNLLTEADDRLRSLGLRSPEAAELLAPAAALLDEPTFWRYQADGLAIFLRPQSFRAFRLPLRFPELASVGDRFHVKPLLPYFAADGHFFVLALSQNEIRLLEGSRHQVDEVELGEVPASLADALRYEDPERELLFHVIGGGTGARAVFHGHGAGDEFDKERLGRFFREVDRGLGDILGSEHAPLVLAGVQYATAIYREVSTYPELTDQVIAGNPDHLRPEELHAAAWAIIEPRFRAGLAADLARFRELDGTGRTSRAVADALSAVWAGRVAVLFASADEERWGTVTEDGIQVHDDAQPGDEDLLNGAVVAAIGTGARIHVLPSEELPAAPIAAILRY